MEYRNLKEKIKELNKKEAKFYGNMFAKMTKYEQPETKVSKHHESWIISLFLSIFTFCFIFQISEPQTAA